MKRILAIYLAIIPMLVSCVHDQPEHANLDNFAEVPGFKVLRESDLELNDPVLWDDGEADTKATYSNVVQTASGILSSVLSSKVHQVVGTYTSTDVHGNPVTVSGKIVYPKNGAIRNMVIVSHYTIASNLECPSESFNFESLFAALGYSVVITDYVGYGVTADTVHPYLQGEVCARNVIDMALAARPFLKSRGLDAESDEVILVGYSQGGATTMHVQMMMENDEEYAGQFRIKKNYAGAGPYDIAKTYDYCVKKDRTGIPCAIPMLIQGMSVGMSKPLDMKHFFKEPLLSHYDEWLNSKKYTVYQVGKLMGSNLLSKVLTPEANDKTQPETARFYKELQRNSIPTYYYPGAPIFMFHSEDDQTVPFVNSQMLQRQFRSLGFTDIEYDFGHYGNHQKGCLKFILKVAKILK